MTSKATTQTYKKMLGKVEAIVDQVSDPEMDLDDLVEKVEEGYGLIRQMRTRLEDTKMKVEALREEYEDLDEKSDDA